MGGGADVGVEVGLAAKEGAVVAVLVGNGVDVGLVVGDGDCDGSGDGEDTCVILISLPLEATTRATRSRKIMIMGII